VGHGEKKTRKLDQFIAAMMSHGPVEAAAAAGIAASTARRWMKDPVVIRRLAEPRRDAMNRRSSGFRRPRQEPWTAYARFSRKANRKARG
jgi:hypothetical protein